MTPSAPTIKERPMKPIKCKLCGDVLWIVRSGLVCPRGHGRIIQEGVEDQERSFPELAVTHDLSVHQRGKILRGAFFPTGSQP